MLLEKIKIEPLLSFYIRPTCDENDVGVSFDPSVLGDDYLIIKVDEYFQSAIRSNTPRGNDCLIIQKCSDFRYKLYLVELKNITELTSGEKINKHIYDKFQNCFDILMSDHFRYLFYDEIYQFEIKLYFISHLKKDKKQKNMRLDSLLSYKANHFGGRKYGLESQEPYPMIMPC